jgi:hypothetical protein
MADSNTGLAGWIRRLFCSHAGAVDFVRNIHGDEVFEWGGKRSIWRCRDCDGRVLEGSVYPAFVQELPADHRWRPIDNSDLDELHQKALAALSPDATRARIRDAAPALLDALSQTWQVIDAAGLQALMRGVELGPAVWFVKASDARAFSMVAIAEATGEARPAAAAQARTVESLQRELLAIARGGKFAAAWAKVNGVQGSDGINLRAEIGNLARIRELRAQIVAINANAALYYGWGGPGDCMDP